MHVRMCILYMPKVQMDGTIERDRNIQTTFLPLHLRLLPVNYGLLPSEITLHDAVAEGIWITLSVLIHT